MGPSFAERGPALRTRIEVLLVEHDIILAERAAAELVERFGATVHMARDQQQAVSFVESCKLDGVFVALVMFWLFGLLGGRTVITTTYGSWDFSIDVTPLVAIILLGTSLNFVHDALEFRVFREGAEGHVGVRDLGETDEGPLRGWVVSSN